MYFYVPIFPVYTRSMSGSLSMVGIIIASYAIPQMLFRIPMGIWFDRLVKRKSAVIAGFVVAIAGALGLGLASSPWGLFAARFTTGIAAASWVYLTVYFTSYYGQENIGKSIGLVNFVNNIAIVAATLSGGFVADIWGDKYTFYIAVLLGIIALTVLLFTGEPPRQQVKNTSRQNFTSLAFNPVLLTTSAMGILVFFTHNAGILGFIPIYADAIGASSADLGVITMLSIGSSAVASLSASYFTEKIGNRLTIILGAALIGISMMAIPFIHHVYILALLQIVQGFGKGAAFTVMMALSIKSVSPEQRATAMGIYQASYAVGMMLGPLLSGFLADSHGLSVVFYLSASLCLLIIGMAFLPFLPKR